MFVGLANGDLCVYKRSPSKFIPTYTCPYPILLIAIGDNQAYNGQHFQISLFIYRPVARALIGGGGEYIFVLCSTNFC